MSTPPAGDGVAVVDKPAGMTSHDVVARVRRLLGTRRVGHAGTLDPPATGVLVVGVGRATRLLGHLGGLDKSYLATVRLGAATTTDDATGEPLSRADPSAVSDAAIAAALSALTGPIRQVPPAVSAVHVDGRRAYARVRAGERVNLPAREVTVYELALVERRGADVILRVRCSRGTYVRALARDAGAALGVGAHLAELRRTAVGPFARPVLLAAPLPLLDLPSALRLAFPVRELTAGEAADVRHGRPLPPSGRPGPVGALGPDGAALALLADRDGHARPLVVLAPA